MEVLGRSGWAYLPGPTLLAKLELDVSRDPLEEDAVEPCRDE